jgi:hypothetical protein
MKGGMSMCVCTWRWLRHRCCSWQHFTRETRIFPTLCCWIWSYLSYGVGLVLVQSGPSCPHAHSRLICHSLLLVELFIDTLTFFPWVLFGFHALVWALGLGFSAAHMRTCCYYINYQTHSKIGGTYTHILITLIMLLARIGQTCCSWPLLSGTGTEVPVMNKWVFHGTKKG